MFTKTRFTACMKGIIDIQGRLTEPFCLVVALAAHKPDYDKDFTQVTKILFSLKNIFNQIFFSISLEKESFRYVMYGDFR